MKRSTLLGLLCLILFTSTTFAEDAPAAVAQPPAAAGGAAGGGAGGGAPEGGGAGGGEPAATNRSSWEDDLDKLGEDPPAPAGGGDPGADPNKNKRSGAPGARPGDKNKPAAPAGGPPQPDPDEPPANLTTNADLRKWAADQRKAAKAHEATIAQLNQRVSEFEKQVKDAGNPVEMARQLTTMKQQVEDYENRVRLLDYERSDEYNSKFVKPYENAWKRALSEVAELEVTVETGEMDENQKPKTANRPATKADFQYVMQLPLGKASAMATRLFKENAALVMSHYNRIRELRQNATDAIEDYKTKGKEREEQTRAEAQRNAAAHNTLWKTANERMSDDPKRKEFWGKSDDPEEQAELQKGFDLADKLFGDGYEKLSMEDKILLHASIRHHVAGFRKLAYRNKKLRADIAARDATIAELRGSRPGPPAGGSAAGGGGGEKKTWQDGIDALPE